MAACLLLQTLRVKKLFHVKGIIAGQETLRLKFDVSIPYPDCDDTGADEALGTCEGTFFRLTADLSIFFCVFLRRFYITIDPMIYLKVLDQARGRIYQSHYSRLVLL